MAPSMVSVLLWNMMAWFAWGLLILLLRYNVERKHQQNAACEAQEALEANI
jgi:heme exporter protein C